MQTIVLDFETYYDNDYSLRKMTPVEYIQDPRFEIIGCAVKAGTDPAIWMTEPELRDYLAKLPAKVAIISHNALFDMCIVSWKLGYVPHLMIDTLGMARAWLGHKLKSLALNSVAMELGLGVKGDTVHKVVGMGIAAIKASGFYEEYAAYSCNDAELCYQIYDTIMRQGFPPKELGVLDTVLRCAVQPKFMLDSYKLAEHLNDIRAMKQTLLGRCGLSSRDDLMSNEKFAEALRTLGVDPPMKTSLTTGKETYAFSKTDPDFLELEDHPDPAVSALVAARLGVKSTIEETRTEKLMKIANLTWQGNTAALMPMPLRYSGAHTHRLSGDWKLNMQNLPSRGNNKIRSALIAPPGHQVVTCDSSQIEARMVGWICEQENLVEAFAKGQDVYSLFASEVFGRTVTKGDKAERFVGKTAILGLGYGLGWAKFQKAIKLQSKAQTGQEIILTDDEAQKVVTIYRQTYEAIPRMWRYLNNQIPFMASENMLSAGLHPITFQHGRIVLPSGLSLHYHNLKQNDGQWWFTYGGKPKYLYGGKMLENIVQALARIVVMDAAMRIRKRLSSITDDVWLNLQVHDELVYIVPDDLVPVAKEIVLEEMRRCPVWADGLPLDGEVGVGPSYGDAK
jgi:DNA polymerase